MTLTFADTHNMVSYLSKSDASKGFNQIIDFLNRSYIAYALTVNPTIYVSCIKQFWNTVAVKQSNNVTRLQALVDKKIVAVTEAAIKDALHFDDAEGVDCLSNEEIFTALAHMGYEKPSTKLTFYKAFLSSQWKFLIHTILQSMSAKCTSMVGKGCSGVETPLFEGMLVVREPKEQGDAEEQGSDDNAAEEPVTTVDDEALDTCAALTRRVEHLEHDKVAKNLEITKLKTRVKKLERANKGRMIDELDKDEGAVLMSENEEKETEKVQDITGNAQVKGRQAEIYQIDIDHAVKVLSMQEDEPEIHEAVEVITTAKLITEVVAAVSETVSIAAVVPAAVTETVSAAAAVPIVTDAQVKSKAKGKGIMVEEPKPLKKKQQVELDEAYARKLHKELNQDINWEVAMDHVKQKAKMDYFKGMSYDDIRPVFEAKFNSNIEFLLKSKEQMEEEENRAIASINKTPAQKATKRKRLNEEAEDVEELKQHLEIVPDEDDDVYTEATP
nr:hypothetical protein [Tanacetum cinerariifolium]